MATIDDKDADIQRTESLKRQAAKVLAFFILKNLPSGVEPSCGSKRRVVKLFEFRFYLFVEVIEIARNRGGGGTFRFVCQGLSAERSQL